jgi:hypothetical protein
MANKTDRLHSEDQPLKMYVFSKSYEIIIIRINEINIEQVVEHSGSVFRLDQYHSLPDPFQLISHLPFCDSTL